jgi:hypothetical protein
MSTIATHDFLVVDRDCLALAIHLVGPGETSVDLTGYTAELELAYEETTTVITEPELEIEPTEGTLQTLLEGSSVQTLPLGRITRHRWVLIESGGCRRTVLQGYIERL